MQPGEVKSGKAAIVLSNEARNLELKAHHFHNLPKFYEMANEDVIRFLKVFEALIAGIPLTAGGVTVSDGEIRKKVFSMCLQDKARNWLLNQPGGSLPTWDSLYKAYVNKFYPPEKTQHLRTQIMQFQQMCDETFYEARERFLQLLSQCPHHRIDEMNLCIRFYEGLN